MENLNVKRDILDSLKALVSDGETISCGNESNFKEFADENNYDVDLVEEVYNANSELLDELWKENQ